jgi:hypothetical protein
MSTSTATLTQPVARFEAARLPDGAWTVADLLKRAAIVPKRRWDEDTAGTLAGLLDEAPGYAALFRWSEPASGHADGPGGPAAGRGVGAGAGPACAFCWQPAAPGAWVELRLYSGPGLKIGELTLKVCAGHLDALRPAYDRGLVECRVTRLEPDGDQPPGVLYRRPEDRL